jgi:hypothetical protein
MRNVSRHDHAVAVSREALAKGVVVRGGLGKSQIESHRPRPGGGQAIENQRVDFPRPRPLVDHELQRPARLFIRRAEIEKLLQVGRLQIRRRRVAREKDEVRGSRRRPPELHQRVLPGNLEVLPPHHATPLRGPRQQRDGADGDEMGRESPVEHRSTHG